ncbi:MAG: polymer-forming cytoskeletal protein [Bacteroidetes bacterium]|nr:polymer-forming cytoskeletal protein [Bacteroidota bacterium]
MARLPENPLDTSINRIVEGTSIKGDIRCESNIRIDGVFVGDLITKGRLVVGPNGKIEGNVTCQNAELEGQIKGKIQVQQLLTLKSTAKVEGDMVTDKLAIEPGANFTGSCSMGTKIKDIKIDAPVEAKAV